MGVVSISAFLRHSAKYQISTAKIWRHVTLLSQWKLGIALPLVTWIVTITPEGRSKYIYIYIYTYIMHIASTQSKKVMPTSLEHGLKYRCRKVNRGRHTLETRMNGTWHDIPNTTHLREKGRKKERVLKSTISKRKG